jgi:hypothetical protein
MGRRKGQGVGRKDDPTPISLSDKKSCMFILKTSVDSVISVAKGS